MLRPAPSLMPSKTGFRTNSLHVNESNQLHMFRNIGIEPKRLWSVGERLTAARCKVRIDAQIPATFICGKLKLVECTVQNLSEAFLCSELPYPRSNFLALEKHP